MRSTPGWQESESIFLEFEGQCKSLKHRFCVCCRRTGIRIAVGKDNICNDCKKFKDSKHYLHSNLLPIWFDDDGVPQYHVPDELSCLTLAEKMLIQLASPFIHSLTTYQEWHFWHDGSCLLFRPRFREFC